MQGDQLRICLVPDTRFKSGLSRFSFKDNHMKILISDIIALLLFMFFVSVVLLAQEYEKTIIDREPPFYNHVSAPKSDHLNSYNIVDESGDGKEWPVMRSNWGMRSTRTAMVLSGNRQGKKGILRKAAVGEKLKTNLTTWICQDDGYDNTSWDHEDAIIHNKEHVRLPSLEKVSKQLLFDNIVNHLHQCVERAKEESPTVRLPIFKAAGFTDPVSFCLARDPEYNLLIELLKSAELK